MRPCTRWLREQTTRRFGKFLEGQVIGWEEALKRQQYLKEDRVIARAMLRLITDIENRVRVLREVEQSHSILDQDPASTAKNLREAVVASSGGRDRGESLAAVDTSTIRPLNLLDFEVFRRLQEKLKHNMETRSVSNEARARHETVREDFLRKTRQWTEAKRNLIAPQ